MVKKLSNNYIGVSLSHGTMREEDLIPEFYAFLLVHCFECKILPQVAAIEEKLNQLSVIIYDDTDTDTDTYAMYQDIDIYDRWDFSPSDDNMIDVTWLLNEDIWDLLNEIAPDNTYFGAHPGDGSDYGFWTFEEQ